MKSINKYQEIAQVFFKLGSIGFGGPAAHIAMMQEEIVVRRQWLTNQQFLDLMGATNLIPGPNSTEMAIHIGRARGGILGLIIAGISFILPAVIITGIIAWFYGKYGQLPQIYPLFYGIKPAVLAIIVGAIWKLSKTALKNRQLLALAALVSALVLGGINEVLALFAGGFLGMLWLTAKVNQNNNHHSLIPILLAPKITFLTTSLSIATPPLWKLGLIFLKVGSILFGGGYVLIAFLEADLVHKYGWLTQQQLLDAIAIGQFTPGPVLSTATLIGYLIAGWSGAGVATLAIFLPSFIFVALSHPFIPYLRSSPKMAAFLDAINAASVALMAVVVFKLSLVIISDIGAILITIGALIAVIRYQINSALIIITAAILGVIIKAGGLI